MSRQPLTLVLDVGKTHTRLLALDDSGALLQRWQRASRSAMADEGYLALDTAGLQAWLSDTLANLGPLRQRVRAIVPITHGASLAGVGEAGLHLPVADYEFTGFDERPPGWPEQLDPFAQTFSPALPLGLNAATQLDWLQRHLPARMAGVRQWMPYAQYWAWWLSGVASSEVSALGCHTLLWRPLAGEWSALARNRGWAQLFAPLRKAWEPVGLLRPDLARALGLPPSVRVLCGAHDSNACLARYLRSWPRMTLVSSGTWVVVMAAGVPVSGLDGTDDALANVSVRGEAVPTGRFMGGRDIERLCAGADPALADAGLARQLLAQGVRVTSGATQVQLPGESPMATTSAAPWSQRFGARERASLAATYSAQETARCVQRLGAVGPLTVDGPLAHNPAYLQLLAALLGEVHASTDTVEGTARGGHALAHWTEARPMAPRVQTIAPPADAPALREQLLASA